MENWINPVLIAAFVSAIVTGAGWFVSTWQNRRSDKIRRSEKVRDITIAIAAEIAHNINRFPDQTLNLDDHTQEMVERIKTNHDFTPLIPRYRPVLIFEQIIGTIEILPHDIIGPTLAYYKAEYALQLFVEDLRSEDYKQRDPLTKARMYEDYIAMIKDGIEKGKTASRSVHQHLKIRYNIDMPSSRDTRVAGSGNIYKSQ